MEKEEGEGPGDDGSREETPDERAILRYEEDITGLLVTVAGLHGRLERLRHQRDQERGAREEDELSEGCSEYAASLPRGRLPPSPPRRPSPGASSPDLFLAVDEAIASLEETVFSHQQRRGRSARARREGGVPGPQGPEETASKPPPAPGEPLSQEPGTRGSGPPPHRFASQLAACRATNAALGLELAGRTEELRGSQAALAAYREERDKLRKKAGELQRALSEGEARADRAARAIWGRDGGAGRSGGSGAAGGGAGTRREPPRSSLLETLQGLNGLLGAALRESKGAAEALSLALGRLESEHSALRFAERSSERCLEAYEALWGLTQVEQGLSVAGVPEEGGDLHPGVSGWPCQEEASALIERARCALDSFPPDKEEACGEGGVRSGESGLGATKDDKGLLRGYIRHLRMQQAALKLPVPCQPPAPSTTAVRIHTAIRAKVAAVQRATQDTLPDVEGPPKTEKPQRLQELQATRELLADLNAHLHLAEKENRALELQLYTYRSQEAALLLMVRILQGECSELRGKGRPASPSSSSSSSSRTSDSEEFGPFRGAKRSLSGLAGDTEGTGPTPEPERQLLELNCVLSRNQALKERIRSLLGDLEERSHESKAQEVQQVELTWDFFKAHRALVFAYLNAKKKQDIQLCRLETQMGHMGQRQARQLEKLRQALRELEGKQESRGVGVGRRSPPKGQPS